MSPLEKLYSTTVSISNNYFSIVFKASCSQLQENCTLRKGTYPDISRTYTLSKTKKPTVVFLLLLFVCLFVCFLLEWGRKEPRCYIKLCPNSSCSPTTVFTGSLYKYFCNPQSIIGRPGKMNWYNTEMRTIMLRDWEELLKPPTSLTNKINQN